jgi:hypothetical protein
LLELLWFSWLKNQSAAIIISTPGESNTIADLNDEASIDALGKIAERTNFVHLPGL